MKKIYLLILLLFPISYSFADFNPGNFEIRLTNPGGESGVMRVQMRAIGSALPTTDNFCGDIQFAIWWDDVLHPEIVDLDVVQANTYGGALNEQAPQDGLSGGSSGMDGRIVKIGFCASCSFFNFPDNWVLNQWVNIADVTICSSTTCPGPFPPGIDAEDFLIQGFFVNSPNINIDIIDDYTPGTGPLPLNLVAFHATKSGERDAHLTWTTANEENTSHFIIERSFDKNSWETVGSVGAAGYSVDIRNYELTDLEVNNGRSSRVRVYYRLKMVDRDGRSTTSPIESLIYDNGSVAAPTNVFEVFPNPASDGLYVTWDKKENLDQPSLMELFDLTGKLVLRQVVSDKTTQEYIDLEYANVQPGVYMLRILNGSTPLDHKQVVVGQNR